MKVFMMTLATLAMVALLFAAGNGKVTYVDHAKTAEALAKGGAITQGDDFTVSGSHRTGPGQVEVHDKETDILYILDGSATFVTGGTMVGGKMTKAGQWLGTDIQGGETYHLVKGDIITIQRGTPHWFKEVPSSVNYYVVKVLKP
jgi:mannose-6-phosphate isomerase-like protein (cupin superfamily)